MSIAKIKRVRRSKDTVEPLERSKLLAIILRRNKSTLWKWVSYKADRFTVDKNLYFREPSGVYLSSNKVLVSVYIEGISTPFSHDQVTQTMEERSFINPDTGKTETISIPVIEGLKIDSELADILFNRKLADEFTKVQLDAKGMFTLLLNFIILLMCIGILYGVFR